MQKVAIVVSSAVSLPEELIKTHGIRLVPEKIIIENKVYHDRIDITPREFYPILERSENIPTTSAPTAQDFADVFTEAAQAADAIVCITVTKGFSQMEFQSALAASKDFSKIPTVVIDSRAAPGAYGFVTLAAAKAAAAGGNIDEVIAATEDMQQRVTMLFTLDTLKYLAKGGRIGKAALWASSLLDIKPIMEIPTTTGAIEPLERVRTRGNSLARLLEIMETKINGHGPVHVIIDQANVPGEAHEFQKRLSSRFDGAEIYVNDWPLVAAVHCGPGAIGVSFYTG